jgi:hypothetical protein
LRQWYYASQIGTEDAWRSVFEYFPEQGYLARRAKQQLARIYLRERDDARALAIFQEFAALGDTDLEFRAYGLTGECGLLTLQGKYRESAAVLDELWPIRGELHDAQMQKMLDDVMKKNRSKLGPQSSTQWDEWLEEEFDSAG